MRTRTELMAIRSSRSCSESCSSSCSRPRWGCGAVLFGIGALSHLAVVLALLGRRHRHPSDLDAPAPRRARERDGKFRVLVVSDGSSTSQAFHDEVVAHAAGRPLEVLVVAPALASRLSHWTGDDTARDEARLNLDATVSGLVDAGVAARGDVGSDDPIQAADDALREFPADEIVFATHPEGAANWKDGKSSRSRAAATSCLSPTSSSTPAELVVKAREPEPPRTQHWRRDLVAETARILLFALVAGASPIAIVATLAVLSSRRGRTNGLALLVGFVLGQSAGFLAAFLVGSAAHTSLDVEGQAAAALELAFGLALLVIAWPERRQAGPARHTRTKALLERLKGLRPGTAFAVGALLGVGGVKRLSITIVAGATVGVADLLPVEELALGSLYVVVATILVWLPVAAYLVAGAHADKWMAAAEDWLTANERRITFVSTLLFGFLLTSDALVRLL